jgi:DDE superfamily endonuclease
LAFRILSRDTIDSDKIEIWFADEARIGQKNKITRRWAKRGTRPSAPRDQRTASTYIFGAVCPKKGNGAALILPTCNTEAMNLHLAEIAEIVAPGVHAVLMVDQAGWHMSTRLVVPPNITIMALPPKCPELNPVENVWQLHLADLAEYLDKQRERALKKYRQLSGAAAYPRRPSPPLLQNLIFGTHRETTLNPK